MPKLKNSIATSLLHAFLSSAVTTKSVQAFQSSQTHIVCAHDCIHYSSTRPEISFRHFQHLLF